MTSIKAPTGWRKRTGLALKLMAVFMLLTLPALSESQRAALAQLMRDPMAIFAQRSPGGRSSDGLIQTKAALRTLPVGELLLGPGRVIAPGDLVKGPEGVFGPDVTLANRGQRSPILPSGDSPHNLGGHGGSGGGAAGGLGGGGGGGSGGTGGPGGFDPEGDPTGPVPVSVRPPTPVQEIPEPASWAMMLIGFFLLGGMLRRSRALVRAPVSGPTT